MGFADEVEQSTVRPGTECGVGTYLATLNPADRADIEAVLADMDRYQHTAIARVLTKRAGRPVKSDTVARHRRRAQGNGCACD